VATILSMSGVAIPGFWLGIMLILLFGLVLEWLPTHGFVSLFEDPIEGIRHLILPALSMGLAGAALNMRQTRSAMLEVLAQDYVRTARAKGLKESRVIWIHALKNSLLPVVTIMGLQIGRLFGGTVIIETLFAIPGMGRLMVDSIFYRDFPVVQACVLIVAVTVLVANLITDILYAYLDPRIHYG
jgi:peptide/nickel transport system permease protein